MAALYDKLIQADIDYESWAEYLTRMLEQSGIQVKDILEVGSGTGNITLPLARKGFNLTGIDTSEDMLSIADEKSFGEGLNIRWLNGDISSLKLDAKYDAAISCLDTFNYILSDESVQAAFENIFRALKPGGIFIFDINSRYLLEEIYGSNSFNYADDDICYLWECCYDENSEINEYAITFFVREEGGTLYERFEEVHCQRVYDPFKIKELLELSGFSNIKITGFMSDATWCETDEKLQITAVR
ncbi:MAG: class I SAM-dependent methyltransferase [Eubacteriaceae bacterium]|nr:class I SAM-dependent methyltransferase [Eubacteriaceae bacterium]